MAEQDPAEPDETPGPRPPQGIAAAAIAALDPADDRPVDDSPAIADAATLGFADLFDQQPTEPLSEFQQLRAQLFGNLEFDAPAFAAEVAEKSAGRIEELRDTADDPVIPHQAESWKDSPPAPMSKRRFERPPSAASAEPDGTDDSEQRDVSEQPAARTGQTRPVRFVIEPDRRGDEPAEPAVPPVASVGTLVTEHPASAAADHGPALDWTSATPLYAPVVEPDQADRRRWLIGAAVAAVVVVGLVGWWLVSANDEPSRPAVTSADARPAPQATVVKSSAATSIDGQTLVSDQDIVLAAPVEQLTLSIPSRMPDSPTGAFEPRVEQVTISIAGVPDQQVNVALADGGIVTIDLPQSAFELSLRYLVEGVVEESEPSPTNRAAVLLTPVVVGEESVASERVSVSGDGITNLGCVSDDGSVRSCGKSDAEGWHVNPRADVVDVIAQVDLPADD